MKRLGIALGSGGSRGIAHIGFLKALEENGIKPYCLTGCSMGSVVGACYLAGVSLDDMYKEIKGVKMHDLVDVSPLPIRNGALLRSKKLRKKLSDFIPENVRFNQLNLPFSVVATDVHSGKTTVFSGEDKVLDCVIASSSIPMVFRPAEVNGRFFVDGGIRRRVAISEARDLGADVVVAVDVLGKLRETDKKYNVFTLMMRMFDITDCSITELSLERDKPDLYLEPDMGDMSQYKFKNYEVAYEAGYKIGLENVEAIRKLLEE